MRKILLLVVVCLGLNYAHAQSKLGLKFSPAISSNRTSLVDSLYDVEPFNSPVKFSIGLIYDHELTETYYFSTGIIFVPKYVGFQVSEEQDQPTANYTKKQSRRVPIKLFTNSIITETVHQ